MQEKNKDKKRREAPPFIFEPRIAVSDRKNKLRFMMALRLQPLTAIDFVSLQ